MPIYLEAGTARVGDMPAYPGRTADQWDLGSAGYDPGSVVEVVAYPDQAQMEAADRPLGFGVAIASAVEVVYTEQGQ